MPEKSSVDVQKLCDTAEKTDGSVAFGLPLVLSQLEEWSDVGFFPPCWHPSSVLALTEDKQKCWFCSRSEVLQYLVGNSIRTRSLLLRQLHRGIFKLSESQIPFNSSPVLKNSGLSSDITDSYLGEIFTIQRRSQLLFW